MGYGLEVEMVRHARELGLLTCPYVFTPGEAQRMAEAGADVLVPHMGLTTKGSIGAETAVTLEESAQRVQAMGDAAVEINSEVIVLCHGGPIAEPEDAQYIFDHTTGISGFFGASSIERLATESAIENQARKFKSLSI
jgi:predicted TIM-barrel enzyme